MRTIKFTIPGENLKRLRDTDLETSGDTSERFSSAALTPTNTMFSSGVFCETASFWSGFFVAGPFSLLRSVNTGAETAAAAAEVRWGLGFWEAFWVWVWRSKKCWMPNLEGGCGWLLLWFDFLMDDDDDDEELGFFLGGIGAEEWKDFRVFNFFLFFLASNCAQRVSEWDRERFEHCLGVFVLWISDLWCSRQNLWRFVFYFWGLGKTRVRFGPFGGVWNLDLVEFRRWNFGPSHQTNFGPYLIVEILFIHTCDRISAYIIITRGVNVF